VGQKIQVQIAEIDDRGKLSLIPVADESGAWEETDGAEASEEE
jgi:polyribonucleotide nucleotidyltransferase